MNSMKTFLIALFTIVLIFSILIIPTVFAHQSGCHRWHSCPSDFGSYECGDTGYCSQCSDNYYCKAGQPRSSYEDFEENEEYDEESVIECSGTALCVTDAVKKIVDGDTIYVGDYKVRLSLTNTPEKKQSGFAEAKAFTKNLCPIGSTVIVDQDDKQPFDKYKRVVGKVICDGSNLNEELLENGHASIVKQYCKKSEFASEDWAKKFGC